jgi:hypothetical protein
VSGPDFPLAAMPASAPIEMIDLIFALSNVRLVKEIVKENLKQMEDLTSASKGQTEGLRNMILQKQHQALDDLTGVETVLGDIAKESKTEPGERPQRNISLGPDHSKALIYALSFAIGHLARFIPGQPGIMGGGEIQGSII